MAVEFPEERTAETDLFPKPLDEYVGEINPPGFVWLPVKGAESYIISLVNSKTDKVVL